MILVRKKKRKFKKSFKRILYFLFILFILMAIYLLYYEKVINFNTIVNNTKTKITNVFKKDKPNNQVVISKTDQFINLFKNRLNTKNLNFSSSSIDQEGNIKIFLAKSYNNSGYLYVNKKDDPDYVWVTFVSAIEAEPLKSQIQNNLKNLEYIDLRFSNKIFYKFNKSKLDITDTEKSQDNFTNSSNTENININNNLNILPASLNIENSSNTNHN